MKKYFILSTMIIFLFFLLLIFFVSTEEYVDAFSGNIMTKTYLFSLVIRDELRETKFSRMANKHIKITEHKYILAFKHNPIRVLVNGYRDAGVGGIILYRLGEAAFILEQLELSPTDEKDQIKSILSCLDPYNEDELQSVIYKISVLWEKKRSIRHRHIQK